jgi:hypothetical protein
MGLRSETPPRGQVGFRQNFSAPQNEACVESDFRASQHVDVIERVAAALLHAQTLDQAEIDALIAQ